MSVKYAARMRIRLLVQAATVAMALAGCGASTETSGLNLPEYQGAQESSAVTGKSGDELVAGAQAALAEAESVTLSGSTQGSQEGPFGADLSFRGPDGSGTYSIGDLEFQILIVDGSSWYKGNQAAYASFGVKTDSVTRKIADRWIIDGSSHPKLAQLEVAGTREELLDDFVSGRGAPTVTAETTIDGVAAVGLEDESGTLFVATDDLRPLAIVLKGDEGDGVRFSYGEVDKPSAPPQDQILDLADLR